MEECVIKNLVDRIEAKLENIQEEMKLQKENFMRSLEILGNDVNGTKRNTILILKNLGVSNAIDSKKTKQATLENWFKKPTMASPEKVDLSRVSGYTGGERRRRVSNKDALRMAADHDARLKHVAHKLETPRSSDTPLTDTTGTCDVTILDGCSPGPGYVLSKAFTPQSPSLTSFVETVNQDKDKSHENLLEDRCFTSPKRKRPMTHHDHENMSPVFSRQRPQPPPSEYSRVEFPFVPPLAKAKFSQPQLKFSIENHTKHRQDLFGTENVKSNGSGSDDDETVFSITQADEEDIFPPTPPRPPLQRRGTTPASFATPQIPNSDGGKSLGLDDFDRLPRLQPKEPNFAYKPEKAVRKKAERKDLPGWDCPSCRDYYDAIGSQLGEAELEKLRNKCSKHRSKLPEPDFLGNTPRYFWDPDFPSTQECLQKGLLRVGERSQAKRPLYPNPDHR